ncbi:hypothetical protein BRX43_17785 [Sphingomonas sp. S-NIH.Pt15_0812]|jgi:hypothetical protein|nr:hypothetical protein BRX43_17785 [Sphingomonas sp. S-NIH.Pt15_0812]
MSARSIRPLTTQPASPGGWVTPDAEQLMTASMRGPRPGALVAVTEVGLHPLTVRCGGAMDRIGMLVRARKDRPRRPPVAPDHAVHSIVALHPGHPPRPRYERPRLVG